MKTIKTRLLFNTFRTRKDDSLGFSGETPELTIEEQVAFMQYKKFEVEAILKPVGVPSRELMEIKGEVGTQTPSQRLRSVLFVWWKQNGEEGEFETFYRNKMEKFINIVKDQLEGGEYK